MRQQVDPTKITQRDLQAESYRLPTDTSDDEARVSWKTIHPARFIDTVGAGVGVTPSSLVEAGYFAGQPTSAPWASRLPPPRPAAIY